MSRFGNRWRADSFAACALVAGLVASAATASGQDRRADGLYAELVTNKGTIVIALEAKRAPLAVASFVGLAEGTIANDAFPPGRPFYDGSVWHRVVPGHVIQAGAPVSDAARGAGYTFPNEVHPDLGHGRAGMVGVANGGPHTNGNQFYVTLGDRSYLDGDYIVFGEVVAGLDVVFEIVQGDVIESLRIVRVGASAAAFRPTTESFRARVVAAEARVARESEQRRRQVSQTIADRWPGAVPGGEGLFLLTARPGSGASANATQTIIARYSGQTLRGTTFRSLPDGSPGAGTEAATFTLAPGDRASTEGLDRALRDMQPGERRIIIVSPELGFGTSGYYAPNTPGEPRFVIRPDSTLVYEIELLEVR